MLATLLFEKVAIHLTTNWHKTPREFKSASRLRRLCRMAIQFELELQLRNRLSGLIFYSFIGGWRPALQPTVNGDTYRLSRSWMISGFIKLISWKEIEAVYRTDKINVVGSNFQVTEADAEADAGI
jgi:hypothetical protein